MNNHLIKETWSPHAQVSRILTILPNFCHSINSTHAFVYQNDLFDIVQRYTLIAK